MAAIDFPASPSVNQTHTASGVTWTWDGTSWKAQGSTTTYTLPTASTGTLGGVKVGGNFSVDGAGTLSLSAAAISGLSDVTATNADYLMLWDATDSSLKKVDAGELIGGGGGGGLSSIGIQSGGTQVGSGITQLNFIGTGNTFAVSGNTVDVSISGGDTVDAIIPVAMAYVTANTAGTGTGISWGAYNSSNNRIEFTFATAQPNANYFVLWSREQYAQHEITVTNKTTTGFRTTWTNNDGSDLPPSTFGGGLVVYASNPLTSVGALNTNDGVVVKNSGSLVGTAGTINFGDNLSVTAVSAGIVTVTSSTGVGVTEHIRSQTLTVAGVSTFAGWAYGSRFINSTTSEDPWLKGVNASGTETSYVKKDGTAMFAGNINANGNIVGDNSTNITGIAGVTASTLTGTLQTSAQPNVNSLGTLTGLDVNGDIDVDGHTNLDNVSIAGVVTATSYQGSASALTDLNATKITSGTVPTARLGSGTANNSVFLRGDNTWATPSGGGSGISNVIDDTTPQLGGNLDLTGRTINGTGTINITGDITATNFYGNGANLTNLPGTGYFAENSTGIHTTSNVGIGTTTASTKLTVLGNIEIAPTQQITRPGQLKIGGAGYLNYSDNHGSSGNQSTFKIRNSYGGNGADIEVAPGGDFYVENRHQQQISRVNTSYTNAEVNTGSVTLSYKGGGTFAPLEDRLYTSPEGVTIPTGSLVVEQEEIKVGSTFKVGQAGIVTATKFEGDTLKSRAYVHATTGSLAVNATSNLSITGHKSYALLNVGVSTAAWVRLYTDSAGRGADAGRSIGEDPSPGSGVIADIVTTGFSTSQVVSPGTIGFNNDISPSQTIYVSVKNMGIQTQPVTVNLQILQLESNS